MTDLKVLVAGCFGLNPFELIPELDLLQTLLTSEVVVSVIVLVSVKFDELSGLRKVEVVTIASHCLRKPVLSFVLYTVFVQYLGDSFFPFRATTRTTPVPTDMVCGGLLEVSVDLTTYRHLSTGVGIVHFGVVIPVTVSQTRTTDVLFVTTDILGRTFRTASSVTDVVTWHLVEDTVDSAANAYGFLGPEVNRLTVIVPVTVGFGSPAYEFLLRDFRARNYFFTAGPVSSGAKGASVTGCMIDGCLPERTVIRANDLHLGSDALVDDFGVVVLVTVDRFGFLDKILECRSLVTRTSRTANTTAKVVVRFYPKRAVLRTNDLHWRLVLLVDDFTVVVLVTVNISCSLSKALWGMSPRRASEFDSTPRATLTGEVHVGFLPERAVFTTDDLDSVSQKSAGTLSVVIPVTVDRLCLFNKLRCG